MIDINELVGPEPVPVPSPKFPTPWGDAGPHVISDRGAILAVIGEAQGLSHSEANAIAMFIAQAVNVAVTQRDGNTFYSNAMKNAGSRIKNLRAANDQLTARLASAQQQRDQLGNHLADARSAVDAEEGETVREAVTRRSLVELAPILKQIREVTGADNSESTLSAVERVVTELDGIRKIVGDV